MIKIWLKEVDYFNRNIYLLKDLYFIYIVNNCTSVWL